MAAAVKKYRPDRLRESENKLVFSYLTLRNLIGLSAFILPIALIIFTKVSYADRKIEGSISDYFYTSSGDILVVTLSVAGVFLFTYKGYNLFENIVSSIAGISGIAVAFNPTVTKYLRYSFSVHTPQLKVHEIGGLETHIICTALFFISLIIISLFCFPGTDEKKRFREKITRKGKLKHVRTAKSKRNIVYKLCGYIMAFCVVFLVIYYISDKFKSIFGKVPMFYIMEAIAVEAFAISWLTKGETFFPDGEHYLKRGYRSFIKLLRRRKRKEYLSASNYTIMKFPVHICSSGDMKPGTGFLSEWSVRLT